MMNLLLVALLTIVRSANARSRLTQYESERIYRNEFVKAMREAEDERERAAHRKSLMDRILQMAERVMPSPFDTGGRRLNDQYFKYEDVGDWNIVGNMAGMAIKYTGCRNIKRWDDNMAMYGEDSPLMMDRFVMFRLCEADSCSAYNEYGCSSNFGEYILPMEDYLELMAEYHFQQFSRYCKTCYHCMKLDYYNDDDGEEAEEQAAADDDYINVTELYGYGDDFWAGYNRYWGEPGYDDDGGGNRQRHRRDGYSYYKQGGGAASYYYGDKGYNFSYGDDNYDGDWAWYEDEDTGKCIFENVCSDFRGACKAFNPNATFYETYFTCSKFTVGNNAVYLAPHCRSDGFSIGIGIYSDAYCSEFIGDEVDISEFTGQNFEDQELENYYDKTCLSCSAADGYSLITDDALNADEGLTYPLCTVLYQSSAKCNLYAENVLNYNDDQVNQEANEEEVCDFLEAMHEQTYNEYGTIVLDSGNKFDFSDISPGNFFSRASPFQQIGLVFSILLFVLLGIYSSYLTKKLYYRKAWRPPRSVHSPFSSGATVLASASAVTEAGRLSRANSGIMAMRSQKSDMDGGSSYMRDGWGDDFSHSAKSRSVRSRTRGQFS